MFNKIRYHITWWRTSGFPVIFHLCLSLAERQTFHRSDVQRKSYRKPESSQLWRRPETQPSLDLWMFHILCKEEIIFEGFREMEYMRSGLRYCVAWALTSRNQDLMPRCSITVDNLSRRSCLQAYFPKFGHEVQCFIETVDWKPREQSYQVNYTSRARNYFRDECKKYRKE
jgi:hypothetical protein